MTYQEELADRIRMAIAEEMKAIDPQQFIEALSKRLSELVIDEITFKLRR